MADSIASATRRYGRARSAAQERPADAGTRRGRKAASKQALDSVKMLRARFRLDPPDDSTWRTMRPLD